MAAVEGPIPPTELLTDRAAGVCARAHAQRCSSEGDVQAATKAKERLFQPYCGTWIKDKDASQTMDSVCTLLGLSRLLRQAINWIRGLDISLQPDGSISVSVFSAISFFRISEKHQLCGGEARNVRRDMRLGGMTSHVTVGSSDVRLDMRWRGAYAAAAHDVLSMLDADTLVVTTTVCLEGGEGKAASATQVYRRA